MQTLFIPYTSEALATLPAIMQSELTTLGLLTPNNLAILNFAESCSVGDYYPHLSDNIFLTDGGDAILYATHDYNIINGKLAIDSDGNYPPAPCLTPDTATISFCIHFNDISKSYEHNNIAHINLFIQIN